jgi:polysaccharide pyruvyl transferase WcaK-like protein
MKIEIYGAGSSNRGALLMIHAVLQAFRKRGIDAQFAVDPMENLYFEDRVKLDVRYIYSMVPRLTAGFARPIMESLTLFSDPLVRRVDQKLGGFFTRSECDALIDISGFRYGDYWGVKPTCSLRRLSGFYSRQGKPVVLLPQMLGPFNNRSVRRAFSSALDCMALVYARDHASFAATKELTREGKKVRQAPDITIALQKPLEATPEATGIIVPNSRVYISGEQSKSAYFDFLIKSYQAISKAKLKPRFLLHEESNADQILLKQLVAELHLDASECQASPTCPLELSQIIASAQIVISSRYHACVTALSSGVPVLTVGWAHKYEGLHRDFEVPDWVMNVSTATDGVLTWVQEVVSRREHYRQHLLTRAIFLKQRLSTLWDETCSLLGHA